MQVAMTSPACCALNGCLYIIGEYLYSIEHCMRIVRCLGGAVLEEGDSIDLVMRYNPRRSEWSNDIAPMRSARSGAAAVVLRRKIYVCGGLLSNSEHTNLAEVYDPSSNQWQYINSMREHRYRPGAAVLNEKIFVCGGQDERPGKYHESVECYSPETDQWTIITELICGRSFLACAMLLLKWSDIVWDHMCEGEANALSDND
jgi:N-acetylneuraminic acid mutarotase